MEYLAGFNNLCNKTKGRVVFIIADASAYQYRQRILLL